MPTNVRDPRTIITPDAFEIAPRLMGTPLAPPWRRFWALMVDLVVILILTATLDEIAVFVWGIVGLFFIRVAFVRPTGSTGQTTTTLLRVLTGCLGLVILSGVGVAWMVFSLARDEGESPWIPEVEVTNDAGEGPGLASVVGLLGGGLSGASALEEAQTAEEAEAAASRVVGAAGDLGLTLVQLEELLLSLTPDEAPWADDADDIYTRVLDRWRDSGRDLEAEVEAPAPAEATATVEVAALEDDEVLAEYARLLREGLTEEGEEGARARALRARAQDLVAADTLASLRGEVTDLREELDDEEARRREAEEALEESGSPMVGLLRDIWEQLGSAIGLWSIYFTVLLTLWKGQTVGKRLLGLRVVRLDGEPMTWWSSFERAGGYIAGLATGLLGFAQVFWDANRQCIHDKIVGTVVVDTRAKRDSEALGEAWESGSV